MAANHCAMSEADPHQPSDDRNPTWAVTATVREPSELVLAFVAHHLELGAQEVIIYLDDPRDPVHPILKRTEHVRSVRCTERHWTRVNGKRGRPGNQNARQARNATDAYKRTGADYLLHLDADEFLHLARPFAEEVARLGEGDVWLRVPAVERCWLAGDPSDNVFSGVFRHPIRLPGGVARRLLRRVYGAGLTPYLKNGLAGASHGKPLVRCGLKAQVQVHAAKLPGKDTGWAQHKLATGMHVLHFDGLTPLHWVAKSLRYAEQGEEAIDKLLHEERARQVREVRDRPGPLPEIVRFFSSFARLSPEQAHALTEHGLLSGFRIDPEGAMRRVFPEVEADFSFRAFDLRLGKENAKRLMSKMEKRQPARPDKAEGETAGANTVSGEA